jgi:hypothetical protein
MHSERMAGCLLQGASIDLTKVFSHRRHSCFLIPFMVKLSKLHVSRTPFYLEKKPMAGQVKMMIDTIIRERSQGNPVTAITTETKLILKGINPKRWRDFSPDDPETIELLKQVATEFGITV